MAIQDKPNQATGSLDPGGWYRRPASPRNFGRIWISPCWDHTYRDLDYQHEPFNNNDDVVSWNRLGFTQKRFTGDMYDMRRSEPRWMAKLRDILPLKYFSWSLYRMRPGDVLPHHRDTYARFREVYDVPADATIRRYIIFMEDWQPGHYFEIDGTPMTRWIAGSAVLWHNDIEHLAANLGRTPRYTLQITGVIDPANHPWRLQHANDSIFQ